MGGSTGLIRYDAAVTALAKVQRLDEAVRIRNQAEVVRVYAVQAKDIRLVRLAVADRDPAARAFSRRTHEGGSRFPTRLSL